MCSALYKDVFKFLEIQELLDSNDEVDLLALHHVYLPRVNASLTEFCNQWNYHGMRTAQHQSPMALWHSGMVNTVQECFMADPNTNAIGIDIDEPIADIETGNNVVVPENVIHLTDDQCIVWHAVNPLHDDGNNGVHNYMNTCQVIRHFNV